MKLDLAGPQDPGDRPTPAWLSWLETSLITTGTIAIGWRLHPQDPFFLRAPFSWTAIAPLLVGLRYGFAHGFGSAFTLILGLATAWRYEWLALPGWPVQFSIGLLATGMIAGEFRDLWTRRLRSLTVTNDYRQVRLDEFTRAYHLLKVSHDRLEQRFVGSTQSLRGALMGLRRQLTVAREGRQPISPRIGEQIVSIFANYAWIQVASLYPVTSGTLGESAVAHLGGGVAVDGSDPLVCEALQQGQLVSIKPETYSADTRLLAAIPIVDVNQHVWGLIAVREVLFVAFHQENLQLLAVIAGHIGDLLASGSGDPLSVGTAEEEFWAQLRRCLEDERRYDLPAVVLAILLREPTRAETLLGQLREQRRGLDQLVALPNREGHQAVLLLMPLTDQAGLSGYLTRLESLVDKRHGCSLAQAGVEVHSILLRKRDTVESLRSQLAEQCQLPDHAIRPPLASA